MSGDEFVILCEDLAQPSDVDVLAARIHAAFDEPFLLPGAKVTISASVGIAYAGPGESVSHQLVRDADTAMYQAKHRGGAVHQVIDLRAAKHADDRDGLEQDLKSAARRDELHVAYQPIVRLADGVVTGAEALLRWTHPRQGPISAVTAVSIAEQSDLIVEIGAWVLERACRDRVAWAAQWPDLSLDLSVNLPSASCSARGWSTPCRRPSNGPGWTPRR